MLDHIPYNKIDHIHCFDQEESDCGIKGLHRCCLCEAPVPKPQYAVIKYKGKAFIRGDICNKSQPDHYPDTAASDWYWEKGKDRSENSFLYRNVIGDICNNNR